MKEKAIAKIKYCRDKLLELKEHPNIVMSSVVKETIHNEIKECDDLLAGGWDDEHMIKFSLKFYNRVKEFYTLYSDKPFSYKNENKSIVTIGYVGHGARASRLSTEILHRKV